MTVEREGDEQDAAVAAYGSQLFGLALAITGSRPDAEDAYQAAWLDAIRHWDQLRDPDRRQQWLASIVVRRARRALRLRHVVARCASGLNSVEGLGVVMHWDPSLATALSRLSARQRAVVALHYGHGYSLDECASIIGCSGGTVRSHLARALSRLRQELGV